jgi:hypothetical protein
MGGADRCAYGGVDRWAYGGVDRCAYGGADRWAYGGVDRCAYGGADACRGPVGGPGRCGGVSQRAPGPVAAWAVRPGSVWFGWAV